MEEIRLIKGKVYTLQQILNMGIDYAGIDARGRRGILQIWNHINLSFICVK